MFNRFFKNKEDGKGGPPGHRHSQPGAPGGAALEEPQGGGFFNLPPPVAKPASSQALSVAPPANGAAPPPAYGARPQTAPSYSASSYGNDAAPAAGGDMFGGMSLKNPAAVPAASYQPAQYGGNYGGSASAAPGGYAAPVAPTGGSLFSGLDIGGAGTGGAPGVTVGHEAPSPAGAGAMLGNHQAERRKTPSRGSGSFNYLDVSAGAGNPAATSISRGSSGSAGSSVSGRSSSKVVRKKKKSFRPGFGRQLSDESIAALQRGDLTEEDIIQQQQQQPQQGTTRKSSITDRSDSYRSATNPTDLAHLLPPVTAGSVLKGLTVHSGNGAAPSGGGVLAGLTVHKSTASPRVSKTEASRGSVLSGLQIRSGAGAPETSEPKSSTPVPEETYAAPEKPSPPPAPAAPPTPEERLLITLRDFNESAVNFRESVHKQNDEENRILERKAQLANQLTQYEIDLRDVEAQQHHAVEVEDFEKADTLNGTINSVKHLISLTESDIRKVDSELVTFVKNKEKAFANQIKSTRGTLRELEKFRDDQEMERSNLQMEFKKYEADESEQLQFEAERIETEMHHVSVNLQHVATEKKEIETTIEDQCSSEFALQEKLMEEKEAVEEEVRELERKLKLKLERVHELQSAIDVAQRDIDVVRGRYSRQLKRIDDREQGILKTKVEVESDGEQLVVQREEFKQRIGQYGADISTITKRITAVRKEMRAAALLAGVLEVQETRREQSIVRKRQHTAELSTLNDAVAVAEQSFTMLRNQHDELEKSLSIHRNAIASAEAMIPRLEQEKKTAAAQRNFKEAARISKDIKALEKDRSTAEEMVEVVEMELQDLKDRIVKRETEFEEKKEELKTMEKQLELNSLQELWKEAKHLRSSLRKLEKCKTEGAAADDGIDFRSSALLLVQAEYDACTVQIDALERKYDVSDLSKDEVDESEDEEDDSMDEEYHEAAGSSGVAALESSVVSHDVNAIGDGKVALEEIATKLTELEGMIETATENEDYELAAQLDEKVEILKRRRESIVALTQVQAQTQAQSSAQAAESPVHVHDDHDEDEEFGDAVEENEKEEENYPEEYGHEEFSSPVVGAAGNDVDLPAELENVQLRIKMLEKQIDLATENEDFETAATYDEELQALRGDERELQDMINGHGLEPEVRNEQLEAPELIPAPSAGLFGGLGIKAHSSTSLHSDTANELQGSGSVGTSAVGGLFGGLELNSSSQSVTNGPPESVSLFGGLQINGGSGSGSAHTSSFHEEVSEEQHTETEATVEVVETFSSVETTSTTTTTTTTTKTTNVVESPTSSRMMDSFFGERPTPNLSPELVGASAAGSMFSGLQLSGPVKDEPRYPADDEDESGPEPSVEASTDADDDAQLDTEEKSSGLFGGLQVSGGSVEPTATPEGDAKDGVEEDAEEDGEKDGEVVEGPPKSAGDTPMTILELSDHSEAASHRSVIQGEDLSESAATATSSGLFGGLSLTGVTMTSTTTTMATTMAAEEDELEEKVAAE